MPLRKRQAAVHKVRELWAAQPIFLDTETTGLKNTAEIVEISIVDFDGRILLDALVRPRNLIPADATRVHGITNEMVEDAPTWLHIWPRVETILTNRIVGIYNADYDLRLMRQTHQTNGIPWRMSSSHFFCIMKLYAEYCSKYKWQKLEVAGRQCGIAFSNVHRAKDDTLLARAIFQHMVNGGR